MNGTMKILAVFAHPDDEAFGPSGTLSRYALNGHEVRLVTMTQGEAGSLGPAKHLTPVELGQLRSEELRCSARALHLSALSIFDLPDGKLAQLPAEQGLSIIRSEMKSTLPDAIITFHAAGISGHPDHQAVARWCFQAAQEHGIGLRLYAFGISEEQAARIRHRKLAPIPEREITHVIDVSKYLEYKYKAIHCHQSQDEGWQRMKSIEGGLEAHLRNEHFSQVWPVPKEAVRAGQFED